MYKPIYFFIGLRYLWNPHLPMFKKVITIISVISISIAVFSLIIIISVMNGFENNFKKNILSFVPHIIITNKNKYIDKSEFPKNILKLNNIERISEFINKEIIIKKNKNITLGEVIGIDVKNFENIRNYNIKNIFYTLKPGKYNTIIGKQLAQKLHVNIGDQIQLIVISNNKNYFLGKIYNQKYFTITGIFSTQNQVDYYQILINRQDSLNFLNYSKNYITGWRVWLKNPFSLGIDKIKNLTNNLLILDWKSKKGELFQSIQIEKYIMLFLFSLILLVAHFNIITILSIYIIEKNNTIAILKTLGLSQCKIMLIFIILGSSISIFGSLLGTILSVYLIIQSDILNFFMNLIFNNIKIPIIIQPSQIFFINIIAILISISSTLYPAWNAIKSTPARILCHE